MATSLPPKIGIVLQGTPHSKESLRELCDIYSEFADVCVSSYSRFKIDGYFFINNDSIERSHRLKHAKHSTSNVNLQIITTQMGIEYFIKHNYDWVLKLRADFKVDNLKNHLSDWIEHLTNMKQVPGSPFEHKIVCFGRSLHKEENPWYIADYFSFGSVKDMRNYWNIPLVDPNLFDYCPIRVEEYISTSFIGRTPNLPVTSYFYLVPHLGQDFFSLKWDKNLVNTDCQSNK